MAQGFDKLQPLADSDMDSAPVRLNFQSLVTDHAGVTAPADPENGWTWLDVSLSNQPKIHVYWDGAWRLLFVYNIGSGSFVPSSGGAAALWGAITGTLSDQTDLQAALDGKLPLSPDGISMTPVASNPGGVTTVWLNSGDGHLYRGSVDLEASSGSLALDDLTDVSTTGAVTGDVLKKSAGGDWVPGANTVSGIDGGLL